MALLKYAFQVLFKPLEDAEDPHLKRDLWVFVVLFAISIFLALVHF